MGRTSADNSARRTAPEILAHLAKLRAEQAALGVQLEERLALETSFPALKGAGGVATKIVSTPYNMEQAIIFKGKQGTLKPILFYADTYDGKPLVRCTLAEMPEPYKSIALRKLKINVK